MQGAAGAVPVRCYRRYNCIRPPSPPFPSRLHTRRNTSVNCRRTGHRRMSKLCLNRSLPLQLRLHKHKQSRSAELAASQLRPAAASVSFPLAKPIGGTYRREEITRNHHSQFAIRQLPSLLSLFDETYQGASFAMNVYLTSS